MREIDDTEGAEYQRQPKGNQRIGAALVEPVEKLSEDRFHLAPPVDGPDARLRRNRAWLEDQHIAGVSGPSSPPKMAGS
jgi:hypothetical protein